MKRKTKPRKAKQDKAKLPFDPKVFLAKVNGGRSISNYQKDQTIYTCLTSAPSGQNGVVF